MTFQISLQACPDLLEQRAHYQEVKAGRNRIQVFQKWAKDAMVTGPAPLFAMTKLKGWAHQEVDRFGIKSPMQQAIADNQMDYWNGIWKGEAVSKIPKEEEVMGEQDPEEDAWGGLGNRVEVLAKHGNQGALGYNTLGYKPDTVRAGRTRGYLR